MVFERNLYAESWRVLCFVWPCVLTIVLWDVVEPALSSMATPLTGSATASISAFLTSLLWALLAYMAHAEILLPVASGIRIEPLRFAGFALRLGALSVLGILLLINGPPFVVIVLDLAGWIDPDVLDTIDLTKLFSVKTSPLLSFLLVLGFLFPFLLIGTLLPAHVADRGRGLGQALGRTLRQLFPLTGWLVAGPALIGTSASLLYFFAAETLGWSKDPTLLFGFSTQAMFVMDLINLIGRIFAAAMLSVLLARIYLRDSMYVRHRVCVTLCMPDDMYA